MVFQPAWVAPLNAPPGIVASAITVPTESCTMTRRPFVDGSSGGSYGRGTRSFFPDTMSCCFPAGCRSPFTWIFALVATRPKRSVHGSHASPRPSWSVSSWPGSATAGQTSCASQTPSPSVSGSPVSAGHAALVPVQNSGRSHAVAGARQTVAAGASTSAGHAFDVPEHCSATSHGPEAGRQTPVLFASAGHPASTPVHCSATSHGPAAGRQTVPAGASASAGHAGLVPSHVSAASHGAIGGRHTAPAFPAGWVQASAPSHTSAVHGLPSSWHAVPAGAAVWLQPESGSHVSVVHGSPSSQAASFASSSRTSAGRSAGAADVREP